jgi:transketolase
MRNTFVRSLLELAERDERVLLLTADLGYTVLEPFADRFPSRFFNVGVAEQNAIGLATGLADAGFVPFVYSIATFATMRPYEFIRNGPLLHRLPVRVVGVGGGFEYSTAGPTHHALEDVALLRVQPAATVIVPADFAQARTSLHASWDLPGPIYYRLGKDETRAVPGLHGHFELGRAQNIRAGDSARLFAMGPVAIEAVAAAEQLAEEGLTCGVTVVASVAPAPVADLAEALARTPVALSVEAHYAVGGLGSLLSEVIAEHGLATRLIRCGVTAAPTGRSGSEQHFLRGHGLDRNSLVSTVREALAVSVPR